MGRLIERTALGAENLRIGQEQILALHPRSARSRANKERDIAVAKGNLCIISCDADVERRKGAIQKLHHDALQRGQRRCDLKQMQIDGRIAAEHLARGHAKR